MGAARWQDLLELSIAVDPKDADRAGEELRAFLVGRGLDIEYDQQTKTKTALAFFTGLNL